MSEVKKKNKNKKVKVNPGNLKPVRFFSVPLNIMGSHLQALEFEGDWEHSHTNLSQQVSLDSPDCLLFETTVSKGRALKCNLSLRMSSTLIPIQFGENGPDTSLDRKLSRLLSSKNNEQWLEVQQAASS